MHCATGIWPVNYYPAGLTREPISMGVTSKAGPSLFWTRYEKQGEKQLPISIILRLMVRIECRNWRIRRLGNKRCSGTVQNNGGRWSCGY